MQRIDEVRAQFEAMLAGVRATMRRDDCMLVPSDIRQLVGEIDRLGAEVERLREATLESAAKAAEQHGTRWLAMARERAGYDPDLLRKSSAATTIAEAIRALSPASEGTKP